MHQGYEASNCILCTSFHASCPGCRGDNIFQSLLQNFWCVNYKLFQGSYQSSSSDKLREGTLCYPACLHSLISSLNYPSIHHRFKSFPGVRGLSLGFGLQRKTVPQMAREEDEPFLLRVLHAAIPLFLESWSAHTTLLNTTPHSYRSLSYLWVLLLTGQGLVNGRHQKARVWKGSDVRTLILKSLCKETPNIGWVPLSDVTVPTR